MTSPFATAAPALIERGYVVHPIIPGAKAPGTYCGGRWEPQKWWNNRQRVYPNVLAEWMTWPDAGIGVMTGRGLICIDIDLEDAVGPLLEILPLSNVQKKGRKGISLFYRGNTEKIRSKNFRTPERVGLVDLLAEGKQTVLPPSIHPDTGEPYFWWTDDTLEDAPIEALAELDDGIAEQIAEVLVEFGYDPERDRVSALDVEHQFTATWSVGERSVYREANDDAMANFHAWVPKLHLYKGRPKAGGYEAVATWRSSSSGRPLEKRKRNLSIHRNGIEDFGTGEKYTPIDLVMKAREVHKADALNWLLQQLPQEPLINLRKRS
ncbi:bifunctional DNA primase/polymerase [Rhodopseudomonas palustris]|uniref:bifunctional DNA primase/polymerase n=1 Tax=Rhodopseudomonas palustris TaxID=1076 RepID=UPI000CEB8502|nr:bifunctional DNA primase/polymerase [Rhodopseudomonas palustris]PPQ44138.1 hypothetical protein CKO39_07845 [Rhodopseudomonas palustris]